MNVNQLVSLLVKLSIQGHGDKKVVCYPDGKGEPLEIAVVHYDIKLDEVSIALDY